MERTFSTAGYSTAKGVVRLRFTNDIYRQRVLERHNNTDIHLFKLPEEMTKEQAAKWLSRRRDTPDDVKSLIKVLLDTVQSQREAEENPEPPRKRGRPRLNVNKDQAGETVTAKEDKGPDPVDTTPAPQAPRKRGRPRTVRNEEHA